MTNSFAAATYTDSVSVTSADGTVSSITVNILGTNDAAVITPATTNLTESNVALTTSAPWSSAMSIAPAPSLHSPRSLAATATAPSA
ncbi:MAG: hypothetical protein IPO38_03655 [Rhodocyclaceae bacterium]|nr:hypothetical protein [Rhodocyclaceae bacterium]